MPQSCVDMQFCDDCGTTMVKLSGDWVCRSCEPNAVEESDSGSDTQTPSARPAELNSLQPPIVDLFEKPMR